MRTHVKICGITDADAALAAVEAGADSLGFVFHPGSPRLIEPEKAASIAARIAVHIEKVAVFLRPEPGEIESVLRGFDADRVQADHSWIGHLPASMSLPVYRLGEEIGLGPEGPRRFLLEGRHSGVGERVDWGAAAAIASRGDMILAGGLDPGNVARAIDVVNPFGVDVSSGVESAPGVKDPARIQEFLEAVRQMDSEKVNT